MLMRRVKPAMGIDPNATMTWTDGAMQPVGADSSLKTWKGDQWKIGGGTTWGWYSFDPQLNLLYYGMGNPSTWNPAQRPGDNPESNSITKSPWECGAASPIGRIRSTACWRRIRRRSTQSCGNTASRCWNAASRRSHDQSLALLRVRVPATDVRTIAITYAGMPVMSADIDFSISANPNFRFYFVPHEGGELKAVVVDTKEREIEGVVEVLLGEEVKR
jgi:hypothetical protein